MAIVSITYFRPSLVNDAAAVISASDMVNEIITSSATSQSTTATATENRKFVRVVASGGAVYMKVGASPTAVNGEGMLLADGAVEYLELQTGHKVAVID